MVKKREGKRERERVRVGYRMERERAMHAPVCVQRDADSSIGRNKL